MAKLQVPFRSQGQTYSTSSSPLLARRGRLRQRKGREASDAAQTGWWLKLERIFEQPPRPRLFRMLREISFVVGCPSWPGGAKAAGRRFSSRAADGSDFSALSSAAEELIPAIGFES